MANTDARKGLTPIRHQNGDYTGQVQPYYAPSTYATAIFVGDAVVKTGTANTSEVRKKYPAGVLPEVNRATVGDGNAITGAVVALEPTTDESAVYGAASTERVLWVCDDPAVIYEIQSDSANAVAATDIGSNANLVDTHSGNTNTGLSGTELNTASMTTTSTYQLRIMRLVNRDDNELGTNAKLEVMINNNTDVNGGTGI